MRSQAEKVRGVRVRIGGRDYSERGGKSQPWLSQDVGVVSKRAGGRRNELSRRDEWAVMRGLGSEPSQFAAINGGRLDLRSAALGPSHQPPAMASPASSTSSTSSVHHASLVDPALHSPALLELIDVKVSRSVIEYVVDRVVETVDYAMGRPTPSSSKSSRSSRGRTATRRPENAKFTTFVSDVITRAEVTMPTLLATLVYIDRARPHLHIGLEQWALERVFLGALIVASKYLNDSTLKNVHWALCTGVFGKRDVGRIEREYLDVLNFELKITEDDLLSHHEGLAEISHLTTTLSPRSAIAALQQVEMEMEVEVVEPQPSAPRERRHRRPTHAPPALAVAVAPSSVPELSPSSCDSSPDSDSTSSAASFSPRTPPDAALAQPETKMRVKSTQQHPSIAQQMQQQPTATATTQHYGAAGKLFHASRQLFHIPRLSTA